MLTIKLPETEYYNHSTEEFVTLEELSLELEHSLVSLSKWESKWEKPFLTSDEKSHQEIQDYVRCMVIGDLPEKDWLSRLSDTQYQQINEYITSKMTATWFSDRKNERKNSEAITSELIYYWMISMNIPIECQEWHINRLLTLIRVCNEKNKTPKKMSRSEMAARNRELNAKRRAMTNSTG